jgi:DNA-binding HxlR family transcriptional regulator
MSPGNKNVSGDCMMIREVLSLVGDKWSVQVVAMLGRGPMRFSVLRRSVDGISQRMLTLTLRGLERDGLITRLVTPTVPPRVDYELTKLGRTLLEPVSGLVQWAGRNREKLQAARNAFDARQSVMTRRPRSAVIA